MEAIFASGVQKWKKNYLLANIVWLFQIALFVLLFVMANQQNTVRGCVLRLVAS